jgi:hypothetical protein
MKIPAPLATLGLAVLLTGCDGNDPFYALPAQAVASVIDQTSLPIMVFGDKAATAKHWRVDAKTSMWAFQNAEEVELLRLSATTIAEGDGTRVHIDVLPPESPIHDQVEQGLKENAAYRDLYTAALAEQINADLNNRVFNIGNIAGAAAHVTLAALPHIREGMENAAEEFHKRDQENIDRAYENEK